MAELYRALDPPSDIERLLKDERYQEAKSLLAQRVKQNPRDREATLYLLLVNVTLHGLKSYEKEVESLRIASDLSDSEKEIVRRLFLIAFTSAEKKGEEKRAWLYQRLLRRLVINQPLDQAPLKTHSTEESGGVMKRKQLTELENHPTFPPSSRFHWAGKASGALSGARKPIPLQIMSIVAAIVLLAGMALYFLQGEFSNDVTSYMESGSPGSSDPVVVAERIAFPGASATKAETVDKFVTDQLPNLQRIYHQWAQENANLMGSLLVKIKLDAAGNVARVENSAARILDKKFRAAVLEEVRKWKFAKS